MDEIGSQTPPDESAAKVRGYNPLYSSEAVRARDEERKKLPKPASPQGVRRRVMSWLETHLLGRKPAGTERELIAMEGGNQGSDVRSSRVIIGPQVVGKTSGDVARSRIEGLKEPTNNVLQHPRQYPGVTQPPPVDAA